MKRGFPKRVPAIVATALLFSALIATPAQAQFWPSAQDRTQKGLSSSDVNVRRAAARQLQQLPQSVARQLLPGALVDVDPEVRLAAGEAAIQTGFSAAAPLAVQWLSDGDARVRGLGARLLAHLLPDESAIGPLARVLSDPSPMVRADAARALARIRSPQSTRVLLNHLDDASESFQLEVIEALAALGDTAAVLPLVNKVQDARTGVRRAAIRALAVFPNAERAVGPLILALSDPDAEVRMAAARALGALRAEQASDALEEVLLRDREMSVRVAALDVLVDFPSQRGVRLAVQMLNHARQELRSEALASLSKLGPNAEQELRRCVEGKSGVRDVSGCALALGRSRASTASTVIAAAWREGRLETLSAAAALGATGQSAALPVVLEMLNSPADAVRSAAIEAIWQLLDPRAPDGRAVEPLAEALAKAKSEDEIAVLLSLLGRTGSARAVGLLQPYLETGSPLALRLAATRGLGWVRGVAVDPKLMLNGLTAPESALRWETAMAVREGRWLGAAQPIVTLMEQAGDDQVQGLATALWGPALTIRDRELVARVRRMLERATAASQDALLEVFAQMPWTATQAAFEAWVRQDEGASLAKIAEVLGQRPEAVAQLESLLDSKRVDVLANAVWALGNHPSAQARQRVRELTSHPNVSVAANAVVTSVRLGGEGLAPLLCAKLSGRRAQMLADSGSEPSANTSLGEGPTVGAPLALSDVADAPGPILANALVGLRWIGARCDDGAVERELLLSHRSALVRQRAAALIRQVPSASPAQDAQALAQCVREDLDGSVAADCVGSSTQPSKTRSQPQTEQATTVLVVPAASNQPRPGVPFALQRGDGALRFGWADRRGAVYEPGAEASDVALVLPAGYW